MATRASSTHTAAAGHRPVQQPRPSPAPDSKQLSCVNCRRKKVKCDRRHPCSQCSSYDIRCVVPQRRSPWPTRRSNLKAASPAAAASDFVNTNDDNDHDHDQQLSPTDPPWPIPPSFFSGFWDFEEPLPRQAPRKRRGSGLGGTFWKAICSEVEGLGDDFDRVNSAGGLMECPSAPSDTCGFSGLGWLSAPPPSQVSQVALHDPNPITSPSAIRTLSDIFLSNIDPVFKVLHRPTLRRVVTEDTAWPQSLSSQRAKSRRALLSAVCFAAATSMSEDDCLEIFSEPRHSMVHSWCEEVESALSAADLFSTPDFTVLQALTIYVMAIRCHDLSRRTLVSVAITIRLAQASGVHREELISPYTVFEKEMRRRLWAQLLVLDMRCAEDRGLEPVISPTQYDTQLPANVDDEDFDPHTTAPLISRQGTTQMTYSLASARVSVLANTVSCGLATPASQQRGITSLDEKLQQIADGIEGLESRFPASEGGDVGDDEHSLHSHGAHMLVRVVTFKLWLYLHYPVYARFSAFPATAAEESRILVLASSTLLLLERFDDDRRLSRFNWFTSTFIPWHPLAVALAKMCSQADSGVVGKSWPLVARAYGKCGLLIADGSSGTLWRPIKLLFERAHMSMMISQSAEAIHPSLDVLMIPEKEGMAMDVWPTNQDGDGHKQTENQEGEVDWTFETPCFFF